MIVSVICDIAGECIVDDFPFEGRYFVVGLLVHCRLWHGWIGIGLVQVYARVMS